MVREKIILVTCKIYMKFKFPGPQMEIPGWRAAMFISLRIVSGYFCILTPELGPVTGTLQPTKHEIFTL